MFEDNFTEKASQKCEAFFFALPNKPKATLLTRGFRLLRS